jgi:hypothetical protein
MRWQRVLILILCSSLVGCAGPPGGGDGASGFWITLWWPTATGALVLLFGAFCALWAQNTGRNPWFWFLLGVIFHFVAVLVLLAKNAEDRGRGSRGPTNSTGRLG